MLCLSKKAINQAIMAFEVSWSEISGFTVYNRKYAMPMVPDPENTDSGVTIGIGYDCGQYSYQKIKNDWSSVLPLDMVEGLAKTFGLKKQNAVSAAAQLRANNVIVPIEAALQVFYNNTIFDFAAQALKIYPDLPQLHPVEQSVIVGIVYNRGRKLEGDRRKEMKQLIADIHSDNDKAMADTIRAMCRLWPDTLGLRLRRQAEAALIELPDLPIDESDKLYINLN